MLASDLEILVKRHLNEVYNFIYRLVKDEATAADLTQETWLKVWRHLNGYDESKPFKPWLLKIAKNVVVDYWRQKRLIPFSELDFKNSDESLDFSDTLIDEADLPDELLAKAESKDKLKQALSQLKPLDQEIILLHQTEDLTFAEIADILGQNLQTVKSRYRRSLLTLREILSAPKEA